MNCLHNLNLLCLNRRYLILGALTYPLYLIHQNIGYMLFNIMHKHLNKYVILVSVTLVVSATAYLIHIYIEKKYSMNIKLLLFINDYVLSSEKVMVAELRQA